MKNSATDFELFTRYIYQKLVNNDVLKPTLVLHNVKLKGKSGYEHQIDVYWEYEIASNKHRVAIECKNYNSLIPVGKVRDFKGVLDDFNNVNGIMVSSKGFQSGAKKYAREHGVSLKELRTPHKDEVIGEIINVFHIDIRHCYFLIDEECAAQKKINLQHLRNFQTIFDYKRAEKWKTATHFPLERKSEVIYDSAGKKITTFEELKSNYQKTLNRILSKYSNLKMLGLIHLNGDWLRFSRLSMNMKVMTTKVYLPLLRRILWMAF